MIFNRVGSSSDFESECGRYIVSASNESFCDAYHPMIVTSASPYRATSITADTTSLNDAKLVCAQHSMIPVTDNELT